MNTFGKLRRGRAYVHARSFAGWSVLLLVVGCGTPTPTTTASVPNAPSDHVTTAVVDGVVDGDTVRLRIGGKSETVRLIAIDTPETKHPTKRVECFGPEASAFLSGLLTVKATVRIERDVEARDAYGRLLLYVFLRTDSGEIMVNHELVSRGFARPLSIEPNTRYQRQIVAASFDAQQHSRGLWKHCK